MLIDQSDNGIFGNSGELLKQAEIKLWKDKRLIRDMFEEVFNEIMPKFYKPVNIDFKIQNPHEQEMEVSNE